MLLRLLHLICHVRLSSGVWPRVMHVVCVGGCAGVVLLHVMLSSILVHARLTNVTTIIHDNTCPKFVDRATFRFFWEFRLHVASVRNQECISNTCRE